MQSEWATQREAVIIKPHMHLQHGSIYNLLVSLQLIQSQYYMALTLLQRVISQYPADKPDFPIDTSSLKEFTVKHFDRGFFLPPTPSVCVFLSNI